MKITLTKVSQQVANSIKSNPSLFDSKLREKYPMVLSWFYNFKANELTIEFPDAKNLKNKVKQLKNDLETNNYGTLKEIEIFGIIFKFNEKMSEVSI